MDKGNPLYVVAAVARVPATYVKRYLFADPERQKRIFLGEEKEEELIVTKRRPGESIYTQFSESQRPLSTSVVKSTFKKEKLKVVKETTVESPADHERNQPKADNFERIDYLNEEEVSLDEKTEMSKAKRMMEYNTLAFSIVEKAQKMRDLGHSFAD